MTRAIPRVLAILLLAWPLAAASPALAEGLYLTWNDCSLAPAATHDFASTCASNLGLQTLYCAFRLSAPVDSVLGVEVVVDVQHADAALPGWWRLDPDGCRAGALTASFDFTAKTACGDFLQGQAAGDFLAYVVTEPHGAANQARIVAAASILPELGYRQLDDATTYYAARLILSNANTVPPGTVCSGCADPACLVLNSVILRRQPGAVGGDVFVGAQGGDNSNFATWQGGAGASCQAVPARAVTWGRIKSLYR